MTEQDMNKACAECLGYEVSFFNGLWRIKKKGKRLYEALPNFCADKNSHAVLFEYIEANSKQADFIYELTYVLERENSNALGCPSSFYLYYVLTLSAPLLVEAFLRTVGKWEGE